MISLKHLKLENYCGYPSIDLSFIKDNKPINFNLFYGENGIGKSSILEAIYILSVASRLSTRDNSLLFRKLIRHNDYNPVEAGFKPAERTMSVKGVFDDSGEEKIVEIAMGADIETPSGVIRNDFSNDLQEFVFNTDADNPMSMNKFQINKKYEDLFLDIARTVYGYECFLSSPVSDRGEVYYTDFVIYKDYVDTKVHFRRMSAGERKIATLLADICNPDALEQYDIILIDNFSMHIYWKRHEALVDKFMEVFKNKQIFTTDHSGVLINYLKKEYGEHHSYDLKKLMKFTNEDTEML